MQYKTEVKTFQIDYTCDECGDGDMQLMVVETDCGLGQYPHQCDSCGTEDVFSLKYPYMEYQKKYD